MFYKDVDI